MSFPNGIRTNYSYDVDSQLLNVGAHSSTATLTQTSYTYDDAGNRVSKTTPSFGESYGYDALYRLTDVLRGAAQTEDYTYDPVGNRLSSLSQPTWNYDVDNRLLSNTSGTFSYDANGNLTQKVEGGFTWKYTWDAENRLIKVVRGAKQMAAVTYDALGRRSTKTAAGVTTTYEYDGADIFRQLTGTSLSGYWIQGPGVDEPLAFENPSGVLTYYHADGLGSILQRSNSLGNATGSAITYSAFGVPSVGTGSMPAGPAFTGRDWDQEAGLYYYRTRYYDAAHGRFLSEDPLGVLGGINLYVYVGNNPTILIDPSGMHGRGRTRWAATAGTPDFCTFNYSLPGIVSFQAAIILAPGPYQYDQVGGIGIGLGSGCMVTCSSIVGGPYNSEDVKNFLEGAAVSYASAIAAGGGTTKSSSGQVSIDYGGGLGGGVTVSYSVCMSCKDKDVQQGAYHIGRLLTGK
jgi:RHS repeat-associated protein